MRSSLQSGVDMGDLDSSGAHRIEPQDEAEAFLASGVAFGEGAEPPKRIETAGAVVFLSGAVALKLKKAVRFPFMDLSTAALRRAACRAEVDVNRRFAPDLYLGVEAIADDPDGRLALTSAPDGPALDWVVRMRRFDEQTTFDRLAAVGALSGPVIEALAGAVAASHADAPPRAGDAFLALLRRTLAENRAGFADYSRFFAPARAAALDRRQTDLLEAGAALALDRGRAGLVRRCHGDLHLRNVAMIEGRPVLFDAIEFDESFANVDILYDFAFLAMDLWERGLRAEANRLFNAYLGFTRRHEDLVALSLLPLYLSLRATIRAKVAAASTEARGGAEAQAAAAEAQAYFDAAESFAAPQPARLVAVGGLSGTGKTTLARDLAADIGPAPGAVILRSDTERKAMFGVRPEEPLPKSAYTAEANAAVARAIAARAGAALAAGHAVLADAVFARAEERAAIERVAIGASVPFVGLYLEAPLGIRLARVESRVGDASDARAAVALAQESYDTGAIRWRRVDASGAADQTAAHARRVAGRR
jgi:hypothetical protein